MTNIMAKFMWCIARVDSRQYRQNSTELAPENFWVGVEVPLTSEYVFNAEEILKAELGSGNVDVPKPIYTAKALQFCLDKLGEYLRDPESEDFHGETDVDDWSDKSESEATKKDENDGWSDAIDTDSGLADDEPKDEMFNDEEEDWS